MRHKNRKLWHQLFFIPRLPYHSFFKPLLEVPLNLYYDKSFIEVGFNSVIITIMIRLVGLLHLFEVCITIKKIPTYPILNVLPLLFRNIFSSFFIIFHEFQSYISLYPLPSTSKSVKISTT